MSLEDLLMSITESVCPVILFFFFVVPNQANIHAILFIFGRVLYVYVCIVYMLYMRLFRTFGWSVGKKKKGEQ